MRIKNLSIKNFRLLQNIDNLDLENDYTIIVWRNNSWKTSLSELFKKFLNEWKFQFEDFSINSYKAFKDSFDLYKTILLEEDEEQKLIISDNFINKIPKIELWIILIIEKGDNPSILPWLDLNDESNEYNILLEYTFKDVFKFYNKAFENITDNDFTKFIKKNFDWNFDIRKFFIDSTWKKQEIKIDLKNIFKSDFIGAQRHLDDNSSDKNKTLSKVFETYFRKNNGDKTDTLNTVLDTMNDNLNKEYESFFWSLHTDLQAFWYPWLWNNDKKIKLKSELESSEILKWNNSKIYYSHDENDLPESYNWLWYSNLIYIILQFAYLNWEFCNLTPNPEFQVLFIEEPEAHLHPQMQQTFIKQIKAFIKEKKWNIQIVITTHSSHIVSSSDFSKIRYFHKNIDKWTEIKNLSNFTDTEENKRFINKYLTLEKSDMFFADKLIMIEWMVERILLPLFINKIDEKITIEEEKLSHQYISIIEVWWAYSHKFENFLNFLWIKTLIITDIDSVKEELKFKTDWTPYLNSEWIQKKNNISCKVSEWTKTSNYTLIKWLPWKENLNDLNLLKEEWKIKDNFRVAYQIEENWVIWRSFEDSFIIANSDKLANFEDKKDKEWNVINKSEILEKKFKNLDKDSILSTWHYDIISNNEKTDFAFDIMMLEDFEVPKYIKEGLIWLSKN